MKDAQGHGSDSRGGVSPQVAADIDKFAAHQARIVSSVPNVAGCKHCGEASEEGRQVYQDLSHQTEPEMSGWSKQDIEGYAYG